MTAICNRRKSRLARCPLSLLNEPTLGSDHADPSRLKSWEADITGFFAFPKEDRLIVILGVRRALTESPPYDLEPFTYSIYMDLDSKLAVDVHSS